MARLPSEGAEVTVHYLASQESGVIEAVQDGGAVVVVVTEHGAVLRFQLMATGGFITADRTCRLTLR